MITIFNFKVVDGYHDLGLVPICFLTDHNIYDFSGLTLQWFILEFVLFMNFLLTMFLLILRAKFMNLRQDYMIYFSPDYLAITVNRLIDKLGIKAEADEQLKIIKKIQFVNRTQTLILFNRPLSFKLKDHHFDKIWDKMIIMNKNYIDKEEVEEFLKVTMNITKQ